MMIPRKGTVHIIGFYQQVKKIFPKKEIGIFKLSLFTVRGLT